MGRRLYVGNLPYSATDEDLNELFSRAGAVANVHVMRDQATGRARGFAFVEMTTDEGAQKAIDELHEYQMDGRGGGGGNGRREPRW
jgi:RNA recognition motif-containing protein